MISRFATVLAALARISLDAANLYDSEQKNRPSDQRWIYLAEPSPGAATHSNPNGFGVVLNSPVPTDKAGYFSRLPILGSHPGVGTLNRADGFTLNFRIRLLAESHGSNDRAGFSVIVITSDLRGIELGFWENEIWAQSDSPMFTHGEGRQMPVVGRVLRLGLRIQGDNYTLSEGDAQLLTGALRNYSSFGLPYNLANFIFFGDDTTSSSARVEITRIALNEETVLAPSVELVNAPWMDLVCSFREPATYRLQGSVDLKTWETFQQVTSLSGSFTSAHLWGDDKRFLRVVAVDPPLP